MPPAVLVLGGTGFLGQYVVEELTRNNEWSVVVVGEQRSSLPSSNPSSTSTSSSIVKFVPGNLATGHGLLEAMGEAARLGRDPTQEEVHGPGHGLAAVVNCAAISSPAECERDPARAEAVNVPTKLIQICKAFARATSTQSSCPCCANRMPPFLVQLSTDQIYAGTRELDYSEDEEYNGDKEAEPDAATGKFPVKSLWRETETEKRGKDGGGDSEDDEDLMGTAIDDGSDHMQDFNPDSPAVKPINAYARQKAKAELLLTKDYPRSVCLRSSVMYGPLPKDKKAVKGMRFLQFCDEALNRAAKVAKVEGGHDDASTTQASFFDDEFRSFVAVTDVAKAVAAAVREWGHGDGLFRQGCMMLPCAVNVGGPERLSRAQFARLVAQARGLDPGLVKAVPSASVARAVPSPRDISMCVERLEGLLEVKPKSVAEALKDMPPEEEDEEEEDEEEEEEEEEEGEEAEAAA